ncbi:MAG: DUF2155 domain-containing protein [Rhodobacteraceae bacterium]|nr:DUF2155 domain-containing protein [Paracoccaceae bacterium]
MIRAALAYWLLLAASAGAQGFLIPLGQDPAREPVAPQVITPVQEVVTQAPGAVLRALDRISGITTDLELAAGETALYRRLSVTLAECRYPPEDAAAKAFARLVIIDTNSVAEKFNGWMISDSPALSAMDDARYDIWLIRCKTD